MDRKWSLSKMACRLLILTVLGCGLVASAPTTIPLKNSPSDLAWDEWIEQGSQQAPPPRRITTKSLFVFPNLGTDSLPACAEGYRPDSMGRCVKVVKVDENAHMAFLLQKLNSQFATETSEGQEDNYDYDIDTGSSDTSGPFQFNIPLSLPSKSEESIPGDYVTIKKKDPQPPKSVLVEKAPTSSPEVVPEYNSNNKNQFFLNGSPGLSEGGVQQNTSDSTRPASVLLQNSSDSGITLLIPSNGKFENVSDTNKASSELTKELEDVKDTKTPKGNDHIKDEKLDHNQKETTTFEPTTEITPEVTISHSSYKPDTSQDLQNNALKKSDIKPMFTDLNAGSIVLNDKTVGNLNTSTIHEVVDTQQKDSSSENKKDLLLDQIEALKEAQKINHPEKVHYSSLIRTSQNITADIPKLSVEDNLKINTETKKTHSHKNLTEDSVKPEHINLSNKTNDNKDIDIEEKIKIISRLADVSRNTEAIKTETNIQNKPSNAYVRFPSSMFSEEKVLIDENRPVSDQAAAPASLIQFPTNNQRYSPQWNPVLGIHPPSVVNHQQFHRQPSSETEYNSQEKEKEKSQWLPPGWKLNSSPNGEHNLKDIWSQMPGIQRYPYHVRLDHDYHPLHYQNFYPNGQQGGRLNIRHASVNHRQGREDVLRRRQLYQDDSMNYKRSRHPHFRESEELSRILEAFNGR